MHTPYTGIKTDTSSRFMGLVRIFWWLEINMQESGSEVTVEFMPLGR